MRSPSLTALYILLPILMVDAVIEVGLIGTMVGFLHRRAGKWFDVSYPAGSTFRLHGKPLYPLVNQGHTSNGAAGTALILVGFGGLLALWLQQRRVAKVSPRANITYDRVAADISTTSYQQNGYDSSQQRQQQQQPPLAPGPSAIFSSWVVMTILSNLLTLAALIYTFIVTHQTNNQTIDLAVAAKNPDPLMYPLHKWTPENWFIAILHQVPLIHHSDRVKITQELRVMRGWRWNLIPLFILGLLTAAAAVAEWLALRRRRRQQTPSLDHVRAKEGSAY
ncbi:hypothetical protein DV736_g1862, partial [Chaetothyriales sp. CBS 134916]